VKPFKIRQLLGRCVFAINDEVIRDIKWSVKFHWTVKSVVAGNCDISSHAPVDVIPRLIMGMSDRYTRRKSRRNPRLPAIKILFKS